MRNAGKVWIILSAHASLLLPQGIFPDDDRSHPLLYQKVNNALAGSMKIGVHLPVPRGGKLLHLPGDTLSIRFRAAQFELFHALVVPLVHGLQRPPVYQSTDEALS